MSLKVENLEGNLALLTIEVPAEEVAKAITKAYNQVKNQLVVPGFRKGKVPQNIAERTYGISAFYEDAANFMIQDTYYKESKNSGLDIASIPEIHVVTIEKGKPFVYTATVAVTPEVTVKDYKGLEYYKVDTEVSEEDIQKELERVQKQNSRRVPVEGREAQMGDIANIDFDGYVDGKAFPGGKGDGYALTLGSGTFIPGFEEQVAGHNIGDEFDVNVTFPEDYNADSLKGKAAVFKCKLNDLKVEQLPDIDDEFASEVSEFDTLEEYKNDIKAKLAKEKEEQQKENAQRKLIKEAVEKAEMTVPELMVDTEVRSMVNMLQMRLENQGYTLDQYMEMMGGTVDQYMQVIRPSASENVKNSLVLEAIAKAEGLEVTEEEFNAEVTKMGEAYKMTLEESLEKLPEEEKENIKKDMLIRKAADFLYENGVAVDEPAKPEEAKAEEADK